MPVFLPWHPCLGFLPSLAGSADCNPLNPIQSELCVWIYGYMDMDIWPPPNGPLRGHGIDMGMICGSHPHAGRPASLLS